MHTNNRTGELISIYFILCAGGSPRKKKAMAPAIVERVDQETNRQLIMHWIHAPRESRCWHVE